MIIAIPNKIDQAHLEAVKAEMQVLGAPVIRAVWMECQGHWAALEGSHRVVAAAELGMVPTIIEIEYSEDVTLADLGCDDSGDGWSVARCADESYRDTQIYFED